MCHVGNDREKRERETERERQRERQRETERERERERTVSFRIQASFPGIELTTGEKYVYHHFLAGNDDEQNSKNKQN